MTANDSNPLPLDAEVLKNYLTNPARLKSEGLALMVDRINQLTANSFQQRRQENKKLADKKSQEDKEFGTALVLACALAEIKLFIHLNILREKLIEACRGNQTEMEQRYERYQQMLHDRNPYPVSLPQENQTLKEYQKSLLVEANKYLDNISTKQAEVQQRMVATWGADTWESGLKIKTEEIHEKIAEKIDKFEFLNVIDKPDGSKIDPQQIAPEVGKKAQAEMHKVNDELRDFLRERPAPEPAKVDDFNIVQGGDAPQAPPMAPSRSVLVGENAPTPPPLTNLSVNKQGARPTQLEKDAELFKIVQFAKAFKNIGKPLVTENLVQANPKTKAAIDTNSVTRLALRTADSFKNHIVGLQHDATQFVNDLHISKHLQEMKDGVKKEIVSLENKLDYHQSPRLKR